MSAARMLKQIEQIVGFGEQISFDSRYEATISYLGPEGPTHFHTSGSSFPDATNRAFKRREAMRKDEPVWVDGESLP